MIDQPIANFMNSSVLQREDQMSRFELVSRMQSTRQSAFVVCDDGVPVGVVSEPDAIAILKGALAGETFEDSKACDVMASPVHTLPQSSCMDEVIQIMNDRGFRRVPIVDDKNQLVGIVNLTELQTAINGALERRGRDLEITVMARTSELQAANAKLERLSLRRLDRGAQSARHRRQAQRTPLALSAIRKLVFGYSARHRSLQIAP